MIEPNDKRFERIDRWLGRAEIAAVAVAAALLLTLALVIS